MLADAVALRVGEAEDLDWKLNAEETKNNREHAKDFAAMANARGGIIVTGVREDGADHAAELAGVPDEEAKRLVGSFRSLAIGLVRPYIPAFTVCPAARCGRPPHSEGTRGRWAAVPGGRRGRGLLLGDAVQRCCRGSDVSERVEVFVEEHTAVAVCQADLHGPRVGERGDSRMSHVRFEQPQLIRSPRWSKPPSRAFPSSVSTGAGTVATAVTTIHTSIVAISCRRSSDASRS
ncbi:AlbA family DNA-binding domain-containing protein [Streptomyces mirabilis]|uniref:AlbA family DNA-binding domain-containing protein n=1 Tax=Streptomyces mirabilis TaxID=68239 RepID=UPI0033CFD948